MLNYGKRWMETDYVLTSERFGTPVSEKAVSNPIKHTLRIRNEIYFSHSFRHPNAIIMLGKGIPLQTIAERLRNTSLMVLSLYTHSSIKPRSQISEILQ